MAKWHIYTSGSNKRDNLSVYWRGNGSSKCRTNVRNAIEKATNSTKETGLLTYFSACMAHDNLFGVTTESEAINFARFIITELQQVNMSGPFTLWNTTTTPNVRIKERDSEHQKPSTKLVQEFGNHM